MPSMKDPHNLSIGTYAVTDVLRISFGRTRAELFSEADDETWPTVEEYGSGPVKGMVFFRDVEQAIIFANKVGLTLSADFKVPGGGADKTLTIVGVSTGDVENDVAHGSLATAQVPFLASSADGSASPISIT